MLEAIEADSVPMGVDDAQSMARRLLARYPSLKPHDAKAYTAEMVTVFAAYPRSIGKRVLDPVNGPLAQDRFMPTVPDVNRALAGEVQRRERIKANARAHLLEAERRAAKRDEQAEWERERPSLEKRQEQAAALVAKFKSMNAGVN